MFGWFKRDKTSIVAKAAERNGGLFSTHADVGMSDERWDRRIKILNSLVWPTPKIKAAAGETMDSFDDNPKPYYGATGFSGPSELQLGWYASQGFIGYQLCALLMQHWLIDKAITMPAKDAVRKGYDITLNNGQTLDPKILDYIRELDEDKFDIKFNMTEFIRLGRGFGIRIAKFVVDSDDPDYYIKPFNLDGVKPLSYRGIAQIDPYWTTPELTSSQALRPGTIHFYEPTYWNINGETVHRSHLVIYRTGQVADVLKPQYNYGGVSIPQKIYERVYAAERTANEAPMLAMTKRLTILNTDLEEALLDQKKFDTRMAWWAETRDNYGVKINGSGDTVTQFDTTLSDMDNLIMTQFQLVATIAEVPGTKLLGTQPKGFNSTGEFEESSYHEFLESLQADDLNKLLRMHYRLLLRSHINPKFNTNLRNVIPSWNPLDAMTAQEQATVNLTKSQTDAVLITSGIIEQEAALSRIIADPDSGYSGLSLADLPAMPDDPTGEDGDGAANPVERGREAGAPRPRAANPGQIAGS